MSVDDFRTELEALLNKHSMENGSNTPDFILAKHLAKCLTTFDETVVARDTWYGVRATGTSMVPLQGSEIRGRSINPTPDPGVDEGTLITVTISGPNQGGEPVPGLRGYGGGGGGAIDRPSGHGAGSDGMPQIGLGGEFVGGGGAGASGSVTVFGGGGDGGGAGAGPKRATWSGIGSSGPPAWLLKSAIGFLLSWQTTDSVYARTGGVDELQHRIAAAKALEADPEDFIEWASTISTDRVAEYPAKTQAGRIAHILERLDSLAPTLVLIMDDLVATLKEITGGTSTETGDGTVPNREWDRLQRIADRLNDHLVAVASMSSSIEDGAWRRTGESV